jgi:opacity protein-like surface antigen
VRLEADFFTANLYQKHEAIKETLTADLGLGAFKVLYDIRNKSRLTPYFGLGVSEINYTSRNSVFSIEEDDDVDVKRHFSMEGVGVLGVQLALTDKLALDLQYNRTFTYDNNGLSSGIKASHNGQNVLKLGGVFKF